MRRVGAARPMRCALGDRPLAPAAGQGAPCGGALRPAWPACAGAAAPDTAHPVAQAARELPGLQAQPSGLHRPRTRGPHTPHKHTAAAGIEMKGIRLRGAPLYLDMQATTPMDPRVVDAMLPYMTEQVGGLSLAGGEALLSCPAPFLRRGECAGGTPLRSRWRRGGWPASCLNPRRPPGPSPAPPPSLATRTRARTCSAGRARRRWSARARRWRR
jgi:hypothetical protein